MQKKSTPVRRIFQLGWVIGLVVLSLRTTWPLCLFLLDATPSEFPEVLLIQLLNILLWCLTGSVIALLAIVGQSLLDWIEGDDKISCAIGRAFVVLVSLPMYIDVPKSVKKKIYDKKIKIQYQKELKARQIREAEEALERDPLYQKAKKEVDEFLAATKN